MTLILNHGSLGSYMDGWYTGRNSVLVYLLYTKDVIYGDERWAVSYTHLTLPTSG